MKFSLCIEPIFQNIEIYDRVEIAKSFGVDAVELWDPSGYDTTRLGRQVSKYNLPVAVCCLRDNWKYRMNQPFSVVKSNVLASIECGRDFGCNTFICMAGDVECKCDSQENILIENLKRLAEVCEKENVTLLIEALNSICDHKGYYLDSSYIAFEILKSVDSPHIKMLFDCYHMQVMEGNLIDNLTRNIGYIGHFHSAGVPGRHELQLGETNYPRVIQAAGDAGYDRYFGLEYFPSYEDRKSLSDVLSYVRPQ